MEKLQSFTIYPMQEADIDAATEMRLQSWLDTYPNEAFGVSREWVEARNQTQRSADKRQARLERFREGSLSGWIARDSGGDVIGATTPYTDENGVQHVGSLYVNKDFHGTGVGGALMEKVIGYFDSSKPIELEVVTYNKRAKAFYKKWGFEEVPGSESLFDNKIPEVKMIRKREVSDEI